MKVKVMNIGEDGKIALSIKRTLPPEPRPARPARQGGANGGRPPRQNRNDGPRVWQPKAQQPQGDLSFEDMMVKFKSQSEEKNFRSEARYRKPARRRLLPPSWLIDSNSESKPAVCCPKSSDRGLFCMFF